MHAYKLISSHIARFLLIETIKFIKKHLRDPLCPSVQSNNSNHLLSNIFIQIYSIAISQNQINRRKERKKVKFIFISHVRQHIFSFSKPSRRKKIHGENWYMFYLLHSLMCLTFPLLLHLRFLLINILLTLFSNKSKWSACFWNIKNWNQEQTRVEIETNGEKRRTNLRMQ